MQLQDITATLKNLRREVAKGSTPSVKRERALYSALLGLLEFLEEREASLDVAGILNIGARLARLEEQVARL